MPLQTTPVPKCLDKKSKIFGFELIDLFLIFTVLSVLNLLFGKTELKLFLVWIPTFTLAVTVFFFKRGKPEQYLIHFIQYKLKPKKLSAFLGAEELSLIKILKNSRSKN